MPDVDGINKHIKIAVVGGGIFGSTAAIKLSEAGFSVVLFEQGKELMSAASGINQYRMHRGYHYPRSADTIISCKEATPLFETEYDEAIIKHLKHYYAIAKENSFLSGTEFIEVLKAHDLPHQSMMPGHINPEAVDIVVEAQENLYDPYKIKTQVERRLATLGVTLKLNTTVTVSDLDDFDFVVVATYASLNNTFGDRHEVKREYQYEVCEKIVIEIPEELKNISTVVMDGPFMSFDPLGDTGFAVMGHVEHAIHQRSFGHEAVIPEAIKPLLDNGIIKNPDITNAHLFLEEGSYFMPALKKAKHIGSMYTVRTVLPRVDDTDTRPTIVNSVDDRIITIYSGKVGNSVRAANDVLALIKNRI